MGMIGMDLAGDCGGATKKSIRRMKSNSKLIYKCGTMILVFLARIMHLRTCFGKLLLIHYQTALLAQHPWPQE